MHSLCISGAGRAEIPAAFSSNCCSRRRPARFTPSPSQSELGLPGCAVRCKSQAYQANTTWRANASQQPVAVPARPHAWVGTLPSSSCVSCGPCTQQQHKRPRVMAALSTAAAKYTAGDSSSSCKSSSPPVGPQRAATQRSLSSGATVPQAAATAAVVAAPCSTQQSKQERTQQQHSSMAHHDSSSTMSGAHVWLPDKQLWLPHQAAAVANPTNPLSRSSSSGSGLARVFMASAATAGRKRHMEDRHVLAALHPEHGVTTAQGAVTPQQAVSLAAVFDGHAGDATASYAAQHIPRLLHNALSGQAKGSEDGPAVLTRELLTPRSALAASFHWFDRWWSDARCDTKFTQHGWDESGSTAVIGMVSGQQLVVANAGDSIALMAHNGTSRRLTVEHRLDNEEEVARVYEAGGQVVRNHEGGAPRVVGRSSQTRYKGIMVTRSLGDFAFKSPQPLLSAEPYVATHTLEPSDHLVLLTSDGVTDVLPDDDMLGIGLRAIEQARSRTNNGNALAKAAAKAVMDTALEKGSHDNITVVAMLLDWGSQFDDDPQ